MISGRATAKNAIFAAIRLRDIHVLLRAKRGDSQRRKAAQW
jgi:hypothetical protein